MQIALASRRCAQKTLLKQYPQHVIIDVTSRGTEPWNRLSPFFPHGGIPVSYSPHYTSMSVEGVWQGLKVFENEDIDTNCFNIETMRGIKRGGLKRGKVLGHRKGVNGTEIIGYALARRLIYVPTYNLMLERCAKETILALWEMMQNQNLLLLDYETNCDINDLSRPLSHASLVISYLNKMSAGNSSFSDSA